MTEEVPTPATYLEAMRAVITPQVFAKMVLAMGDKAQEGNVSAFKALSPYIKDMTSLSAFPVTLEEFKKEMAERRAQVEEL